MISLDTNLLVRYFTDDPAAMAAAAERLIEDNECFVTRIALFETFHVLRSVYGLEKEALLTVLRALFALETVTVEGHLASATAVDRYERGMNFADALLLASSHDQDRVATFDRDFSRLAAKLKAEPRVEYLKA